MVVNSFLRSYIPGALVSKENASKEFWDKIIEKFHTLIFNETMLDTALSLGFY